MSTYQEIVELMLKTDYGGRTKRLRKKLAKYRGMKPASYRKFGRIMKRAARYVWSESPFRFAIE